MALRNASLVHRGAPRRLRFMPGGPHDHCWCTLILHITLSASAEYSSGTEAPAQHQYRRRSAEAPLQHQYRRRSTVAVQEQRHRTAVQRQYRSTGTEAPVPLVPPPWHQSLLSSIRSPRQRSTHIMPGPRGLIQSRNQTTQASRRSPRPFDLTSTEATAQKHQ